MALQFHPIASLPYDEQPQDVFVCFDRKFIYVAAPLLAWRAPLPLTSKSNFEQLAMPPGRIQNLYCDADELFLLKSVKTGDNHTFLRSTDSGARFDPIDGGLEFTDDGTVLRLVPTRMSRVNGVIFLNAGGGINLLCSTDEGANWHVLHGVPRPQSAYPGKFLIVGRTAFLVGEAPLDSAYLKRGILRPSLTEWEAPPFDVAPPDIENRNIQFITYAPQWHVLFAGTEGGLVRSSDGGLTWNWVLRFQGGRDAQYPYLKEWAITNTSTNLAIVGGFDKANDSKPFIALSETNGETWNEVSYIFDLPGTEFRELLTITSDPQSRALIATYDLKTRSIVLGIFDGAG